MEGSDIKLAKTFRNLGVCLDPTLSFQQQISSVCRICYFVGLVSEDVTKKKKKKKKKNCCVRLFFQD